MKKITVLLMTLLILSSLFIAPVAALDSPIAKTYYNITVGTKGEGFVYTNKDYATGDEEVTLTAELIEGRYFVGWDITGDFIPVKGDTMSTSLTIKPKSNIVAVAIFQGGEKAEAIFSTPTEKNPISPKTGQSAGNIYAALGLLCIATFGVFFCSYKIKKN